MEASYLTVEFFRRLPQEMEKAGNPANPATPNEDRYGEGHYRRIGSNVSSYIGMVSDTLRNTIPKAVVFCQVREAKLSLLNHFYTQIGKKEVILRFNFNFSLFLITNIIQSWKNFGLLQIYFQSNIQVMILCSFYSIKLFI